MRLLPTTYQTVREISGESLLSLPAEAWARQIPSLANQTTLTFTNLLFSMKPEYFHERPLCISTSKAFLWLISYVIIISNKNQEVVKQSGIQRAIINSFQIVWVGSQHWPFNTNNPLNVNQTIFVIPSLRTSFPLTFVTIFSLNQLKIYRDNSHLLV